MTELTYRTHDKSNWGNGPWQEECDKVQWRDEATGLPCLAVRNHWGAWCGYVGVSREHPAYEKGYQAVYELFPSWDQEGSLSVHGGLTFADRCAHGPEETSICHVPEPGESDDVWWLGFDCGHFMDLLPAMEARYRKLYEETRDPLWLDLQGHSKSYKTLAYVRTEVMNLAAQLASI